MLPFLISFVIVFHSVAFLWILIPALGFIALSTDSELPRRCCSENYTPRYTQSLFCQMRQIIPQSRFEIRCNTEEFQWFTHMAGRKSALLSAYPSLFY